MWGLLLNFVEIGGCCSLFDLFSFLLGQAIFIDCYITISINDSRGGRVPSISSQIELIYFSVCCLIISAERNYLREVCRAKLFALDKFD
mmetsp:Transcript_2086/g.3019  ORF Transcript_2086/g.3019 Transcript_2086/m.3019 type:complete len:89 (-) Transcript_2086:182-448(-)